MIYLLLAIVFATLNAGVLKWAEVRRQDRLVVIGANYICATALSAAVWLFTGPVLPAPITAGLGFLGGVVFSGALFVLMAAVGAAGVAMSTAAYRMSLVWPVLLSIAVFGEVPTVLQSLGVLLALAAIALLSFSARGGGARRKHIGTYWLVGMFVAGGGPWIIFKVFTELAPPADRQALLMLVFFFAAIFCWVLIGAWKVPLRKPDLLSGAAFGVLNVLSNSFLLEGLQVVPGLVAFPVFNSGIMVLAAVLGVVVWRERPGRLGYAAIAVSVAAIVMMNF